jgi:hypothetical protein
MSQYKNYEVEFYESIEWDNDNTKRCLVDFKCVCVFTDICIKHKVLITLYEPCNIDCILDILYDLYFVDMKYRAFGALKWKKYYQKNAPIIILILPPNAL